jgi:malonate transporter and related proteins
MQAILAVTVPFFALVLCGYLAAWRGVLPDNAVPGLNTFVLFFALPCMLFRFGANTPVLELLNPTVLVTWILCAALIVFFTIAITLGVKTHLKDAAFGALVAAFPNTGFMGVPLMVALVGPAAAGPIICTILVDMFLTTSACLAIAELHGSSGASARAAATKALKGAFKNPLPWSVALGAVFSVAGWKLAGPVDVVVRMLADSASPVALFTIGVVLFRAGQHAHTRTPMALVWPVALTKLFLHPLLVFLVVAGARQLGAPLSHFEVMVLTLTAALPSASNVSMLAERYGADNGRVARIIMVTTAAAFVTFTLLSWGFGAQGKA